MALVVRGHVTYTCGREGAQDVWGGAGQEGAGSGEHWQGGGWLVEPGLVWGFLLAQLRPSATWALLAGTDTGTLAHSSPYSRAIIIGRQQLWQYANEGMDD